MSGDEAGVPDPILAKWQSAVDVPLRAGNRVNYLIDGWATLESMHQAIQSTLIGETASYYILLAGWWIDETLPMKVSDPRSDLMTLLSEAAAKGVQVRVLVYKNLLKRLYHQFISRGRSPAEQVAAMNAVPGVAAVLDDHTAGTWQSHHQKLLLMRGANGPIGFCGGVDIARDRVDAVVRHPGSPYHDVHCRIEGPAVRDLMDVFLQRWRAHPKTAKIDEKQALRGVGDGRPGSRNEKGPGNARVGVLRTYVSPKEPCSVELSVRGSLLKSIAAARRFIYAEDQYMIDPECAEAIGKALGHLQFVIFMIPHSSISDLPRAWGARHTFIETVRKHAGEQNFLRFRVFYKLGSTVFGEPGRVLPFLPLQDSDLPNAGDFRRHTYVHAKVWIFDDELAVIGSANCNRRGMCFDSEVAAAIIDVSSQMNRGVYSFAQRLRMALWRDHLEMDDNAVRNPLNWKTLWLKPGYADYVPKGSDNNPNAQGGPFVRHYLDRPGTDAENAGGWLFADPSSPNPASGADWDTDAAQIPSSDFESQWQQIIDPQLKPYKACPRD
ncbi:phospholipase D-like domain-containing protein (plasmid) [Paraburkholderia strydomiana]